MTGWRGAIDGGGHIGATALAMVWLTLWPLVLGLTLSGAVQSFVRRDEMVRVLGTHRPRAIVASSLLGMASSSCSYAASALARSMVVKGADFVSAMVFMTASTNLVIELGFVLVSLLGWQFAASEFVGGGLMILLLAVGGAYVFGGTRMRQVLAAHSSPTAGGAVLDGVGDKRTLARRLRSTGGWVDAASYAVADFTMLRKELIGGYGIAAIISVCVPERAWSVLFFHGHGVWTTVENAVVAPLIAVASFVCSVGNIPLAAALWINGLGFGGVIAFIFADLITFPLLLVYRRYYGTAIALRLFLLFWAVMAGAGLLTGVLIGAAHLVPARHHAATFSSAFSWNVTTFANFVALALALVLYVLHRQRSRWGGGVGYAIDPVCGMQVERALAPANAVVDGAPYFFCSDGCHERFVENPVRYLHETVKGMENSDLLVDPVCGMRVTPSDSASTRKYDGTTYWFCCEGCAERFEKDPASFH